MEIYISDLERHELTATGQGFVRDTEDGALAVGWKAVAGAVDKFLDVLPV